VKIELFIKNIIIYSKIKLSQNGNKKIIMFRVLVFIDLTLFITVIIKNIIKNVIVIRNKL